MAEAAAAHNVRLQFVALPALPFPLPAARAGVVLRRASSLADVLILDSIAAAFLAPLFVLRRPPIPLVAILHQPPGGIDHSSARTWLQAGLDRLVYRRAAALVLASAALAPALPADLRARAVVVPPDVCSTQAASALRTFAADRIVVFTRPESEQRYREDVDDGEIRERFGLPVEHAELSSSGR